MFQNHKYADKYAVNKAYIKNMSRN